MAFDEGLAHRIREILDGRVNYSEKRMFGGICFLVSDHMCCGIVGDSLMARVGPDSYGSCLEQEFVSEMDFTGKPMKGLVYVSHKGIEDDADLSRWLDLCLSFISSLPPKAKNIRKDK